MRSVRLRTKSTELVRPVSKILFLEAFGESVLYHFHLLNLLEINTYIYVFYMVLQTYITCFLCPLLYMCTMYVSTVNNY